MPAYTPRISPRFPDKKDSLLGIAGSNFDWDQILNVFQKTQDRFGSINYVFANAGETSAWNANLETPTKPDLSITENMIRGNVYSTFPNLRYGSSRHVC